MDIADFDINLVEKAFLAVVADQLNMTVDQDIFAGGIPLGYDGASVRVVGEKIDNQPHRPSFYMEFQIKGTNRRQILDKIFTLTKCFPDNNLSGTVGEETIKFRCVFKNHLEIATVADNGKIKHLGILELTVII